MDPQTGVLGSLTADQQARLQLLWMFLLNAFESNSLVYDNTTIPRRSNSLDNPPLSPASFNTTFSNSALSMSSNTNTNIIPPSPTTPITPISPTALSETQSQSYKPQHQRSLRKLRRRISLHNDSESVSAAAAAAAIPRRSSTRKRSLTFQTQSMGGIHLRPSPQNVKVMQRVMATHKISPDELRQGLLGSLKQDHPDSMLLRFLRARKWDVGKAFVMLVSAIAWRTQRMHIDDDILRRGELYALQQSRSLKLDPREQRRGWEFMKQLRMGKNIIHGVDRAGRPIVDIRVRLHRAEDQSNGVLERYIIHTIESVRMLLRPPLVETAILIFDMTDFSMANMDYTPVRFIIKCLENFYPETLGRIIIHKAPWFFSGIWKMIKTWMNDSLVSKVHFTKTLSDLERYIPRQNIPSDLGGSDDKYQYHYIEPDADDLAENLPLDTHSPTRNFLLNQRQRIAEEFLETTRLWLQTSAMRDAIGAAVQQDRRAELIEELRINFWKLDPFIRGRCQLDREGVIVGDGIGTINFYPHLRPVTSRSESFGTTSTSAGAAVTSSDSSSGVLSLSSSTLSASHDHGRGRGRDVDLHTGAVNKPDAQQTMSSTTTTTTTMNMVNFLLDDSDIDHDDSGDDSGYQARDDFMQEYMDDDAGYGNPSSTAANNTTTINNEMQEWKFPEKEIPQQQQHNYTHAVIATTNDHSDITNTKEDTNANNNNPRSDIDTDTDMDIGTDLDDDDEEIEIHDAVTQKITYPRADGFVGRAAVRLVNV